jgi:hypothetical protein
MPSEQFMPFSTAPDTATASKMNELPILVGGRYAFVAMDEPAKAIRTVDILNYNQTTTPLGNCSAADKPITDLAADMDAEANAQLSAFNMYAIDGKRIVMVSIDKSTHTITPQNYIELSEDLDKAAVVGGYLFASTKAGRVMRIDVSTNPAITPCN